VKLRNRFGDVINLTPAATIGHHFDFTNHLCHRSHALIAFYFYTLSLGIIIILSFIVRLFPSFTLHLLQTSPPLPMLRNTMSTTLTLLCLVDGEATPFPVEIDPAKSFGELKAAIKTELSPQFDDVTSKNLTLWRVAISVVPKKDRKEILLANVPSKEELDETDDVSDKFKEQPPKKNDQHYRPATRYCILACHSIMLCL
jgi:hypothetical protein